MIPSRSCVTGSASTRRPELSPTRPTPGMYPRSRCIAATVSAGPMANPASSRMSRRPSAHAHRPRAASHGRRGAPTATRSPKFSANLSTKASAGSCAARASRIFSSSSGEGMNSATIGLHLLLKRGQEPVERFLRLLFTLAKHGTDLGEREISDIAEPEQLLIPFGKRSDSAREILAGLRLDHLPIRVGAVRGDRAVIKVNLGSVPSEVVHRPAVGDGEEPSGEPTFVAVAGQAFQRTEKGLGGEVFCVGAVSDPAVEIAVDRPHVPLVQLGDGGRVAPPCRGEDRLLIHLTV